MVEINDQRKPLPGNVQELLDISYRFIQDNLAKPVPDINPYWPPAANGPAHNPSFTVKQGFTNIAANGLDFLIIVPQNHRTGRTELTWEIMDGVVGALTTSTRLYGYREMAFAVIYDMRQIGYGKLA